MKKSKKIVTGILGLAMVASAFGAGYTALTYYPELPHAVAEADETTPGPQATASADMFDVNGWFTQSGFNALVAAGSSAADIVGVAPGYLGNVKAEDLGGTYTFMATHAAGKIINNKQLPVTNEVSFEIGNQVGGDHGNSFIYFVDSDEIGDYLSLNETKTKLGVMFNGTANNAEVYSKGTRKKTAAVDATNTKSIWTQTPVMHYVSVKFGAGEEATQVYIDNELFVELPDLHQSDFASGKIQLVWSHWGGGGTPWACFSTFNPFTVVKAPAVAEAIKVNGFVDDIVVDLTQPVSEISVINAAGNTVTLVEGTDYTAEGNVVTIKNAFVTKQANGFFSSNTVFTFTAEDNRTTTLTASFLYFAPPVFVQNGAETVGEELVADLSFEVAYTNNETYTMTVNGADLDSDHYSTVWADDTITVTLDKDYINALAHGTYTFTLTTLAGSVDYTVYRKTVNNEWLSVAADKVPTIVNKGDAGSSTLTLGALGHVYYSERIDVTKTVYLELDIEKALAGASHGWFAIGFVNDVTKVSSLTEANGADRLVFLYGHEKGEFQCAGVLANAQFKPEYVNQNGPQLFALTFADGTEGSKTTLTFNGVTIFETETKTQETFANGCYLGIFSACDPLIVSVRNDVEAPAANTYGLEYTLGAETDIIVPMYNTTAVTAVRYGEKQLAATDYSFAEGKLTIKGSYLKTIAYADIMNFVVTAGGVDVKVNVKALSEVDPAKSFVAYTGENGAEYADFAGKTILKVVDMATAEELSAEADYAVSSDGALIISDSYFNNAGVYGFAVVTEEDLYFALAIHYAYDENGLYNNITATNGTYANGTLTVTGESNYSFKGLIDLTKEDVTYVLDITKLNGYYKSGMDGSTQAYIAISFFDMYSGNTITLKLYANDTEESGVSLTYTELVLRDKNGKPVYVNNVPLADTTNYFDESILTKNTIKFTLDGNSLVVELNDEIMYLDLGNTVMSALQLGVSSTADIGGEKNAYSFALKADSSENPPEQPEQPAKKGGCNGSTGIVGGMIALPLLAAGAVVLKKRKSDKK